MLAFLTILLMLGVCYAFWLEGLMTAACTLVNVVIAGLVTFGFYEPIANELDPLLAESFLAGYEDCLTLILLFALVLGLLRLATNTLAYTTSDFHPLVMRGGSIVCGLLTGYLVAGFLVVAFQTIPGTENFLGLDAKPGTEDKLRRVLPPDRVWLAMMHRAGGRKGDDGERRGPFAWADHPTFDDNGNFELRCTRYRRKDASGKTRRDDGALPVR